MIEICLCEDNQRTREREIEFLEKFDRKHNVMMQLSTFKTAEELLFFLADHLKEVDIFLLDVYLPDMSGIELAKKIRNMGSDAQIIFITSSKDHVFEAFDTMPLHYITKDTFYSGKLEDALLKAIELRNTRSPQFTYKKRGSDNFVDINDIYSFEINGRVTIIDTTHGVDDFYGKMQDLEESLPMDSFLRVHRSFMVNMKHIIRFSPTMITLRNGKEIPIGKSYYANSRAAFTDYLNKRGKV
ncbi:MULTISPECIES: LytTR family DNA-binding domain-containing protein [unclassified Breznakia]|uniref:LytR/AlgR family response regulator transcription factor n=1 Tax=unclassified Breznakia TaxID=2623764 RepID=UPI00247483BC|nr:MULTISPECIES: LytTR family DNA-binding domain-containing protein [unclassified Breznakia]MDH6366585.1 two-component system response regulator LytT [Breznakia sp. PH1-1]MDH6403678.1 two-component system response regulator LytT [Breznakia sp. PF1-11]MDH6411387.1 two-component system response regulator LytT [Breznakia sp. PFB1-11]MDH6413637.1 two-component system response regulator LytT [Breznakia sp. PFB1-14]MDH6415932.1 two-component system response regulator LytT [Breznakia sp. PFB1-4]